MSSQDTEITLGTGKMLALFFGLVALCGLFFGLGFSLGKGSIRPLLQPEQAQAATAGPTLRPSAMKSGGTQTQPTEGMTLYKAVEQKDSMVPAAAEAPKESARDSTSDSAKASPPDPMTASATSGYFVQVAAVSKQDDAQALVDALKKKQYAAFTSNTSALDKLFHVQVGPFGDLKDAEATRAKLISDGYNPILKK
jgi:cell division septation protein DedD